MHNYGHGAEQVSSYVVKVWLLKFKPEPKRVPEPNEDSITWWMETSQPITSLVSNAGPIITLDL